MLRFYIFGCIIALILSGIYGIIKGEVFPPPFEFVFPLVLFSWLAAYVIAWDMIVEEDV